jgi:hypothetical protein
LAYASTSGANAHNIIELIAALKALRHPKAGLQAITEKDKDQKGHRKATTNSATEQVPSTGDH